MNNNILTLIAHADFSSAIQEVDKFRKKMDTITTDLGKKMSLGDVGNLSRLYDDFDKLIQRKREFTKAEKRGTFRKQEKSAKRLRTIIGKVDEDFQEFAESARAGGKTVAEPLLHDLNVLTKEVEELRSEGLGEAIGARGESKVENLRTNLQKLPEDTKEWKAQVQKTYEKYTGIKQEQDELISILKRAEAQEKAVAQEHREQEKFLKRKAEHMEGSYSVLANRIIPAEHEHLQGVQEINQQYEDMQADMKERIGEAKKFRNILIKEGKSHEQIELANREILKLQKKKKAEETKLSQEMKEQVEYAKKRNMSAKHTGFGANLSALVNKFRKLTTMMKKNSAAMDTNQKEMSESKQKMKGVRQEQSKLNIKTREYTNQVIRQGGRTTGLLRVFSRWRNRILVATFALAGLIRSMKKMISLAVKARKQFIALSKVSENLGISQNRVTKAAKQLAADGLVSLKEATQSIKALIATGADVDLVVQNLKAMKDAAIANGRAGYTVGQNLVAYARGVKQMRSQLADAAGVMKNISQILKEHPDWVEKYGKATALLKGFTQEAQRFGGSVAEMLKTLPGQVQQLKGQFKLLQTEIGSALAAFSKQLTAKLLVKIQEAREAFQDQEGAVYEWAESLGTGLAHALDALEKFLPALSQLSKAALTLSHVVFGLASALGYIANKMGKWLGILVSVVIQFRLLVAVISKLEFWMVKLGKALFALNFSRLTGALGAFGNMINKVGLQMAVMAPAIKVIALSIAVISTAVVQFWRKAKEKAAETTKALKNNKEVWDKIKGSIGEVRGEIEKLSESLGGYTTEKATEDLRDYLITMYKIKDVEKDISGLKERKRNWGLWGRQWDWEAKSYEKEIGEIQTKINEKQEKLNDLRDEEKLTMKKIKKLAKDIIEEYKIQDVYKEGSNRYIEFLKLSREGNDVLKESVRFTWEQFENWIRIRHQLDSALSGVKELNEEIKEGAREAQKEVEEIQREYLQIGKSDILGEMLGIWTDYSGDVSEAAKNLNTLEERAEKTDKKLGNLESTFGKYINTVVGMTRTANKRVEETTGKQIEGNKDLLNSLSKVMDEAKTNVDAVTKASEESAAVTKSQVEEVRKQISATFDKAKGKKSFFDEDTADIVKEKFTSAITAMVQTIRKGKEYSEKNIQELTDFAAKHDIDFYQEEDLRSYLSLQKELFNLDKNIADARNKYGDKRKALFKLLKREYENLSSERQQDFKDTIGKAERENRARKRSLKYLRDQVKQIRLKNKLISASPYEELKVEPEIQSLEDTVDLLKQQNKQRKKRSKLEADFGEKITETERRRKGAELAISRLKMKVKEDEDQPALDKAISLQQEFLNNEETRLAKLKIRKEEALEGLSTKFKWENKLLKLTQEQERHQEAMQNSRKMAQLSFWEKEFEFRWRQEKGEKERLEFFDKLKDRSKSLVKYLNNVDMKGFGSFISGGIQKAGWGSFIGQDELEAEATKAQKKLDSYMAEMAKIGMPEEITKETDRYKELKAQYDSTEQAAQKHWNSMVQIYQQGTKKLIQTLWSYYQKHKQFTQQRENAEAKYMAKLEYYREKDLVSEDRYTSKKEGYDNYKEDMAEKHKIQMAQYRREMASQALVSAGTQAIAAGIAEWAATAGPWAAIGVGLGALALGGTISATGPSYGKKVAALTGKMGAKREIGGSWEEGGYGAAFESMQAEGGTTTSGTGTETAGGTVSAPPQNININPIVEFNGETIFLTPQGEADVNEVGESLGNSIVNVVQDAIDTGEISTT